MKIYTRGGDRGETGMFGGERVSKDSARIQAVGAVDELNAALGLAVALGLSGDAGPRVQELQSLLFELGAELGAPRSTQPRITGEMVQELEAAIDRYESELEHLRNFILPGGTPGAAALHVARSVCRRAERTLVAVREEMEVSEEALAFINRLSDLLFVLARVANARAGVEDPLWRAR
jgi:cob(I)alamin adenosyltransferase